MRMKGRGGSGEKTDLALRRPKKERRDRVGRPRRHPDPLCASKPPANPQQVHSSTGTAAGVVRGLRSPRPLPPPPPAWSPTAPGVLLLRLVPACTPSSTRRPRSSSQNVERAHTERVDGFSCVYTKRRPPLASAAPAHRLALPASLST